MAQFVFPLGYENCFDFSEGMKDRYIFHQLQPVTLLHCYVKFNVGQ